MNLHWFRSLYLLLLLKEITPNQNFKNWISKIRSKIYLYKNQINSNFLILIRIFNILSFTFSLNYKNTNPKGLFSFVFSGRFLFSIFQKRWKRVLFPIFQNEFLKTEKILYTKWKTAKTSFWPFSGQNSQNWENTGNPSFLFIHCAWETEIMETPRLLPQQSTTRHHYRSIPLFNLVIT